MDFHMPRRGEQTCKVDHLSLVGSSDCAGGIQGSHWLTHYSVSEIGWTSDL